jgi:hypothetical protein
MTPSKNNRTRVTTADSSRLGRQPRRLEKKKNMYAVYPPRSGTTVTSLSLTLR